MKWQMIRHRAVQAALAALIAATPACDTFLDVENPNSLEAENVDAERDAAILSRSAYQSFVAAVGDNMVYAAWFTNEARVGDTFPTRNEFGRRDIPLDSDQSGLWNGIHGFIQYAERTIPDITPVGNTVDLVRAYFTSAWGMLMIGELFCEGTVAEGALTPRGPITSAAMLDSALLRMNKVREIAANAALASNTEAQGMATAALVGIARIHLQNGRKTQASQAAAQVPASFTYNILHLDDPNNRGRLGNDIWSYSEARISLVVPDEFRDIANCGIYTPGNTRCAVNATADPRISYTDMGRVAQDGILRFYRQGKITGWGSPDRLASGLEAQYIKLEADGVAADIFAFVNARRAVGWQPALAATSDMAVLMRELMEQKTRDFWLEGRRQPDFRRLGTVVPYILPPGNNYYKPGSGNVGSQNCWPVPGSEVRNNPNWPKV